MRNSNDPQSRSGLAAAIDKAAREIIDKENKSRIEKTARLKKLRLEHEAKVAAAAEAGQSKKGKGPKAK